MCSVRYRYSRYRYGCTKLTEVSAPVWMSYRIYRSVRYRYWCTEITEVSDTGVKVRTGIDGTRIDVPNLPKCPVPVLMYRTYRSVRYRYWCRTELTEVSGTGNTGGMPRYVPRRTNPAWYAVQKVPFGLSTEEKWKMSPESLLELERRQMHFLGWFLCESDSEIHILVRSQKQISFVQIKSKQA